MSKQAHPPDTEVAPTVAHIHTPAGDPVFLPVTTGLWLKEIPGQWRALSGDSPQRTDFHTEAAPRPLTRCGLSTSCVRAFRRCGRHQDGPHGETSKHTSVTLKGRKWACWSTGSSGPAWGLNVPCKTQVEIALPWGRAKRWGFGIR